MNNRPSQQLILVVDDDVTLRLMAREALAGQGYEVVEASDGAEAQKLFSMTCPDLVLLDHGLPEGPSGLEVCRLLRAEPGTSQLPPLPQARLPGGLLMALAMMPPTGK